MKTTIEVEVLQHTDVRGKDQLYIRVGNHLINVGLKTWEAVKTELIKANNVPRETANKKQI